LTEYVEVTLGEALYVEEAVNEIGLVQAPSEYHWKEYGEVPPNGFAASVIDWPESIVGAFGDIPPAERGPFTVTVSPTEHDGATGLPWDESVDL
jgi:hypothetical protein